MLLPMHVQVRKERIHTRTVSGNKLGLICNVSPQIVSDNGEINRLLGGVSMTISPNLDLASHILVPAVHVLDLSSKGMACVDAIYTCRCNICHIICNFG